jgi:predicted RNA-binding protein YlxR (DUF448 family)
LTDPGTDAGLHGETGPVRSCFACRTRGAKEEMLRLVVDAEGQAWPDLLQKAPGRGAYLCMQQDCWQRLNDRRFGALKAKLDVAAGQWEPFRARLRDALPGRIGQLLTRMKGTAAVGRDAAMEHLWKNAPMLLLIAGDAGEALVRQLRDAVDKRRQAGAETQWCKAPMSGQLGEWLGREKVSVLVLDASVQARKLEQACAWFHRVNEAE